VRDKEPSKGDSLDASERRQFGRVSVDYDLKVSIGSGHDFYTGLLQDISTGGLFIATDKIHRIGDSITVRFAFPGRPDPIEAQGVVRWQRSHFADASQPEGYGIQLEELPPEVVAAVNKHLEQNSSLMYSEFTDEYEDW
jgi:uncharacterized protein (TIGR02266 family)